MLLLVYASFFGVLNFAFCEKLLHVPTNRCPPNSIGLRLNASVCYSFHPSLSQYVIAERECNSFGASLVSLKNKYTNVYVTQLANLFFKHLEVEQFWSSGHRLIDSKMFRWINGDEIGHDNLENKYTKDDQDCVAVNLEKGFWKHENCFTRLPFVCEFFAGSKEEVPPTAIEFENFSNFEKFPVFLRKLFTFTSTTSTTTSTQMTTKTSTTTTATTTTTPMPTTTKAKTCPSSWVYNNATGFCYGIFHNMTWANAEQKCVHEHAHLASIHSKEEALFVAKLTQPSSTLMQHWHGQTFIGLNTKNKGVTWEWSDGTPFDYQQWYWYEPNFEPNNPGIENCGQIWSIPNFQKYKLGDFNNGNCDLITSNSVCKKLPN